MTDNPHEPESCQLTPRRCLGVTSGRACGMRPLSKSAWCWNHDPERALERDAARRRGGRNGNRRAPGPVPEGISLRDVDAIQRVLEQAVRDCLALDNSVQRARTIAYLASIGLTALSTADFEARLAALEQAAGVTRRSA